MTAPDGDQAAAHDADEPVTLSAQHLTAHTAYLGGGIYVLRLTDGETVVDISHEIGDPTAAAERLEALTATIREHAARVRMRGLSGLLRP